MEISRSTFDRIPEMCCKFEAVLQIGADVQEGQ